VSSEDVGQRGRRMRDLFWRSVSVVTQVKRPERKQGKAFGDQMTYTVKNLESPYERKITASSKKNQQASVDRKGKNITEATFSHTYVKTLEVNKRVYDT
jgi:hypothetical protein